MPYWVIAVVSAAGLTVLDGERASTRAASQPSSAPSPCVCLSYRLSLAAPAEHRAAVTCRIDGLDPSALQLRLELPQGYAFVRLPEPLLDGTVEAFAGHRPLTVRRLGPYAWRVDPDGQASVEVRYGISLTHREIDAIRERDAYEHPFIKADHALLCTGALLVYPTDLPIERIRVVLDGPDGWAFLTPWPRATENEYAPPDLSSVINGLIAAGAWSPHELRVDEFVGTVAFAPGQREIEAGAVAVITRIVEHELRLFGRRARGTYLFLFGPPVERSMAGSPKNSSMILAVDPRLLKEDKAHLAHLIAHEFFHTWTHPCVAMPDELRWLNEGVTDYYAYLVPARLGLITWAEFATALGDKMQAAATNPHFGKLSLAAAGGPMFFSDPDAEALIYSGGALLGAWLDRAIRVGAPGQSLDDLMRALLNDPRWQPEGPAPTLRDVAALIAKYASEDLAAQAIAAVREPYAFDPVVTLGSLGVTIRREVAPLADGLRANFDGTRVTDIDPRCTAYRLGLRPGDQLLEVNGRRTANVDEVRAAWSMPDDEHIRMRVERGAVTISMDESIPSETRYIVSADAWQPHTGTRPDAGREREEPVTRP
jgi:predicted metalloprotease with PDZ domain